MASDENTVSITHRVSTIGVPGLRFSALSVRAGARYVVPLLGASVVAAARREWRLAGTLTGAGLVVAATFRHIPRPRGHDVGTVYAVANGKIMSIEAQPDGSHLVRTFLTLLNEHMITCPADITVGGIIVSGTRRRMAHTAEAARSNFQIRIVTEQGFDFTMFAGLVARQITLADYVKVGATIAAGSVIAVIHLGSGTVQTIPALMHVVVHEGEWMQGGVTKIAV